MIWPDRTFSSAFRGLRQKPDSISACDGHHHGPGRILATGLQHLSPGKMLSIGENPGQLAQGWPLLGGHGWQSAMRYHGGAGLAVPRALISTSGVSA